LGPFERENLLIEASKDECPIIEPFIRIALGTAKRKGEILAIQIKDINCASRELFIPKANVVPGCSP